MTAKKSNRQLEALIDQSLALLDPKGEDTQVSRAMTIVRLAFEAKHLDSARTPQDLVGKACEIFPNGIDSAYALSK
ncbi:MAG: hypothetical protein WD708_01135 [Kiritimatiellia bacterium]